MPKFSNMGLNKMGFDTKLFDTDEGSTLDPPLKRTTGIKASTKKRSPYNNRRRTTMMFGQKGESRSNLDNGSVIMEMDDQSEILD